MTSLGGWREVRFVVEVVSVLVTILLTTMGDMLIIAWLTEFSSRQR